MYDSIRIQNFRGIRDLTISNLGRINLLVGANNVGKTSVLEALALLRIHTDGFEIRQLIENRGFLAGESVVGSISSLLPIDDDESFLVAGQSKRGWEFLVGTRNGDVSKWNERMLNLSSEGAVREALFFQASTEVIGEEIFLRYFRSAHPTDGPGSQLNFKHTFGGDGNYRIPDHRQEHPFGEVAFLPVNFRLRHSALPELVTLARRRGTIGSALKALRGFDSRLIDVEVASELGQPTIDAVINSGIEGRENRVPWSAVGDGVRRLWEMLLMLPRAERGMGLIDEVDIGMYFENFPKLWRSLATVSQVAQVQLFSTTHSWECVRAAFLALRELDVTNELRLHRLQRQDDEIAVVTYEDDLLEAAVMDRVEVR